MVRKSIHMICRRLVVLVLAVLIRTGSADAQHHMGPFPIQPQKPHPMHEQRMQFMYGPHSFSMGSAYVFVGNPGLASSAYVYSQPTQFVPYSYPIALMPAFGVSSDPLKTPAVPSLPAARWKSLDWQSKGDERLRQQKWSAAREAYSNSVSAAPDRAEAHLRLGLCYVMIQKFDSAIRQIKRAVFLDPTIAKSGKKIEEMFGPESKIAVNSMVAKLGDWVAEESTSSDRLFLLGAVQHFQGDPKSTETLENAGRTNKNGDVSHIAPFLSSPWGFAQAPVPLQQVPVGLPKLNNQPASPFVTMLNQDLRFPQRAVSSFPIPGAPVPMP